MRKLHDCSSAVRRGPSAEGVPAGKATRIGVSAGRGSSVRMTRKRPGSAARASARTCSSAAISSALARRTRTPRWPARTCSVASRAWGSTRWSKDANTSVSRRAGLPSAGQRSRRRGGGVRNVNVAAWARTAPVAERVPAGTVTLYSVAIGRRGSTSNNSVFVPTQRQRPPGGSGRRAAGWTFSASACDVTATIGCEKVRLTCGASGTSPLGSCRSTCSGPLAPVSGAGWAGAGAGTAP